MVQYFLFSFDLGKRAHHGTWFLRCFLVVLDSSALSVPSGALPCKCSKYISCCIKVASDCSCRIPEWCLMHGPLFLFCFDLGKQAHHGKSASPLLLPGGIDYLLLCIICSFGGIGYSHAKCSKLIWRCMEVASDCLLSHSWWMLAWLHGVCFLLSCRSRKASTPYRNRLIVFSLAITDFCALFIPAGGAVI